MLLMSRRRAAFAAMRGLVPETSVQELPAAAHLVRDSEGARYLDLGAAWGCCPGCRAPGLQAQGAQVVHVCVLTQCGRGFCCIIAARHTTKTPLSHTWDIPRLVIRWVEIWVPARDVWAILAAVSKATPATTRASCREVGRRCAAGARLRAAKP
jgi:hypothetical protein